MFHEEGHESVNLKFPSACTPLKDIHPIISTVLCLKTITLCPDE